MEIQKKIVREYYKQLYAKNWTSYKKWTSF